MSDGGRSYDSGLERDVAHVLQEMQERGEISDLQYQKTLHLTEARLTYRCDYLYCDTESGEYHVADAKGVMTDRFRMIAKLWKYYGCQEYPTAPLVIWQRKRGVISATRTIWAPVNEG